MVYRPNVDHELCFVVMPFGHPFDGYYKELIKPAVEAASLRALRADEIYGTKPIIQDIWEHLWRSKIVVADVTDRNPNVNYELGLCHSLGIPTILLTKRIEDVPFDYRHRRCIVYKTDSAGWEKKLSAQLTKTLIATATEVSPDGLLRWPYDTRSYQDLATSSGLSLESSRKIALTGISQLASLIAKAYGPTGTHVSVASPSGGIISLKRGAGIARGVRSANPIEEHGIDQMREAAQLVLQEAGDGTKSTILLADEMIRQGCAAIAGGHNKNDVLVGMELALKAALKSIANQTHETSAKSLLQIAATAAGGDSKIAGAIVEAIEGAGKDGILSIEHSDSPEPSVALTEGLRFQGGYLSDRFITDLARGECVLKDCRILLFDRQINSLRDLLPVLEKVGRAGHPFMILAGGVEGEALSTLVVNQVKGQLKCVAVRMPIGAKGSTALLHDIAILTGGKAITEELGIGLPAVQLEDLGRADNVVVSRGSTIILGGHGAPDVIEKHADLIRSKISAESHEYERVVLQERLTNLVGRIATIRVGGKNAADAEDQQYRAQSAMHSVRSAIDHGWVCGGGIALLNAGTETDSLGASDAQRAGVDAIRASLKRPLLALAEGALGDAEKLLSDRQQSRPSDEGFNATSRKVENLVDAGTLDSAHTVRCAVEVAFSYARTVLRTDVWGVPDPIPTQREDGLDFA